VRWSWVLAAAIAASIGWALWITAGATIWLALALGLHFGGCALTTWSVPRQRGLALALGLAVPGVGPIAAALAATVRGRGGMFQKPRTTTARTNGSEIAHTLAAALPACDAALSPDPDTRRAALANLVHRASADDVAILRWARGHGRGDIALDAALSFEDAAERFEHRAAAARSAVQQLPGFDTAARAFRVLVEGIETGIVDLPVIARLGAEARDYHAMAVAADAVLARALLADRARLELAVGRPDAALALLKPVVGDDAELTPVYDAAAYAARRFDLLPELAHARA
jgi:hypothetical protein